MAKGVKVYILYTCLTGKPGQAVLKDSGLRRMAALAKDKVISGAALLLRLSQQQDQKGGQRNFAAGTLAFGRGILERCLSVKAVLSKGGNPLKGMAYFQRAGLKVQVPPDQGAGFSNPKTGCTGLS